MKSFLEWLSESFQSGRPHNKRSKEEELELAQQSSIYQITKYEGWTIKPSVHAAAQAFERRPDFEFPDWKELHRRAVRAFNKQNKKSGDFIVFSKSMDQGYVFKADSRKKEIRVITVLPRGRRNPQPGTDVLVTEQIVDPILIIVE